MIVGEEVWDREYGMEKIAYDFFFFEERELQGEGLRDQTKVSQEWNSVQPKGLVMLKKN